MSQKSYKFDYNVSTILFNNLLSISIDLHEASFNLPDVNGGVQTLPDVKHNVSAKYL